TGFGSVLPVGRPQNPGGACRLLAGPPPDRAHDRTEPRTLNNTCQPTAASRLRGPQKVPLRFAVPRQSEITAAALFWVTARMLPKPTDPAASRDVMPVSRFPSSKRAE